MKSNTFTSLEGQTMRVTVIASRFNQDLTDALLADCLAALHAAHVPEENIHVVRVPGSFELPISTAIAAEQHPDVIVCLGVIIKGDTRHDEYIAHAVSEGLTNVALESKIPVIFGVLTTENRAQAEIRALGSEKKGWEAGMSAVETVLALQNLKSSLH